MALQRLSHTGLCVSDLNRSLRFYRDGLGFRRLSALEVEGASADRLLQIEGVKLRAVYLERDGTRIELLQFASPGHRGDGGAQPMNRLGLTHLSFRVRDLDATLAGIEEAGGRVLPHTRVDLPGASSAAVFVTDPDGIRIELVEAPGDPDVTPGT